jgi:hypothetical protein
MVRRMSQQEVLTTVRIGISKTIEDLLKEKKREGKKKIEREIDR